MIIQKKNILLKEVDSVLLFGYNDRYLKAIEDRFSSQIVARGENITIEGPQEEVDQIEGIFSELIFLLHRNNRLSLKDVETVLNLMANGQQGPSQSKESLKNVVLFKQEGYVTPKTEGQWRYFESTKKNDIVFVIGPAGTGKTYLAVAVALAVLKARRAKKIILARPAVEAGESLGYLPGDLREKVDPYLRPLYDALYDMLSADKLKNYLEKEIIEIVPLAYMRGRTFDNAFLILDEAQNTTTMQMKMFLTRMGVNSWAIITGDITQIDLVEPGQSGLVQIQEILKNIDGIDFVYMSRDDVVRHRLVRDIIDAYDSHTERNQARIKAGLQDQNSNEKA